MKPHGVTEDQIKLRVFPFSVQDAEKEWLYDLPSGSITSWNELAKLFLKKHFPEAKVSNLRREILGIKQGKRKALHTYWEGFKKMLCFCEGLIPMEKRLVNTSSGGSLSDITPIEIRALIEKVANESKHSATEEEWYPDHPRGKKVYSQRSNLAGSAAKPGTQLICAQYFKKIMKLCKLWEDFSKGHLINISETKLGEGPKITISSQDLNRIFNKETNIKLHPSFNNLFSKISTRAIFSNHLFSHKLVVPACLWKT
uniref:Retrotransposon gag domain-containing protein n=1 Tax=Lactuca sativa TaxID=4236 RepID=A0A9R1UFJ7_LACSA|nr:hypothetical protein LSAT_V11C900503510 [Lactuca sativa]